MRLVAAAHQLADRHQKGINSQGAKINTFAVGEQPWVLYDVRRMFIEQVVL